MHRSTMFRLGAVAVLGLPIVAARVRSWLPSEVFVSERAVSVERAADEYEGVRREYESIETKHPGCRPVMQMLTSRDGRLYDEIICETPEGETKRLSFDITDWYGKF